MNRKVTVFGIDGGSFNIIDAMINEGRLPNFRKVMENGCHGKLRSTFPPMTFPAWNTFMTGVNPGKHGVFDFTEHVGGKYAVVFTNAQSRKSRTIWRIMSDMERRLAVMGVPLTYPPEKINGIMVSGFDTPVGGMADETVFHPPSLCDELHKITGEYQVSADIAKAIEQKDPVLALQRIQGTLAKKITAALHVFDKEDWHFFMVLFGESDLASHHFWRFYDSSSPLYPGNSPPECRQAIQSIYEKLDEALGAFLDRLGDDGTLLIMSDHGFGGNGNRTLYVNRWLEKEGFLQFLPEKKYHDSLTAVKNLALKYLPHSLKVQIFRRIKKLADSTESLIRFSGIDWERTTAYSEETPYFPSIWLNLKDREPSGIVTASEQAEVVASLVTRLKGWVDPERGAFVLKNVYRRDEIYSGPHLDKAPDLLLEPDLINGYSYLSRSSRTRPAGTCLDRISAEEMLSSLFMTKSGSHRNDGIFMGYGPPFIPGGMLDNANIIDLAPTIFTLMGLPIPADWEGRSLIESQEKKTVEMQLSCFPDKEEYSEAQARLVQERLRDLGYME
jgi:predicted AlkP superfamily phosphohydrolase/phosphomutase